MRLAYNFEKTCDPSLYVFVDPHGLHAGIGVQHSVHTVLDAQSAFLKAAMRDGWVADIEAVDPVNPAYTYLGVRREIHSVFDAAGENGICQSVLDAVGHFHSLFQRLVGKQARHRGKDPSCASSELWSTLVNSVGFTTFIKTLLLLNKLFLLRLRKLSEIPILVELILVLMIFLSFAQRLCCAFAHFSERYRERSLI